MGSLTKATTETFGPGGVNSTNIQNEAITNAKIASDAAIANSKLAITFPTISSLSITNGQPAVYDTETVDINGTDFTNGARVDFIHSTTNAVINLPTVTFVSATQLRVTIPASTLTEGTDYKIRVSNPDGLAATSTGTVLYSQTVSFSTSSGSLGSVLEGESASFSVSASSNSAISYSVTSGSLPTGLSLNSSTGAITGTAPTVAADTTSTFTITATDAESQTASRSFSITVTNFAIDNSLRFNDGDSPTLSITPASTGNRRTWTFSYWIKRSTISTVQQTFAVGSNASTPWFLNYINSDDTLHVWFHDGTNSYFSYGLNKLRDVSAWYHIMYVVDTTQSTASDRLKVYINESEMTWSTYAPPAQNFDTQVNTTNTHYIGRAGNGQYFDGYIAEAHFIDGQALSPTDFGETDSTTNNWIPKKYSGSYGTNGFYLDFSNSSDLGNDSSGNNNDFTPSNLAATDQTTDTPNNNFATLNPLSNAMGGTLSEGNLQIVSSGSDKHCFSTFGLTSGKWYFEVKDISQGGQFKVFALTDADHNVTTPGTNQCHIIFSTGETSTSGTANSNAGAMTTGDILAVAINLDDGEVYFTKNGNIDTGLTAQATGISISGRQRDFRISAFESSGTPSTAGFNFGNPSFSISSGNSDENGYGNFEYAPPSGYLALCTNNLPNVAIADPTEHFNTVLWTGNDSNPRTITGVGFQSDFVWTKSRTNGSHNKLYDSSRGLNIANTLNSSGSDAEYSSTNGGVSGSDSDGFIVNVGSSNDTAINNSAYTYVAWNWKANAGSTSSNTDGSITSTVQANTTAGFSIVTFTGTGSVATVGHGLGKTPAMMIFKNRDAGGNYWRVYHQSLGATKNLVLNGTFAQLTETAKFNNTEPTSNVFTVGTDNDTNASSQNILSYCFAEIEGYSKFGSYTGNGSTDGTFVYTGFRPAFVIIKVISTTENWVIRDNKRDPYNNVYHQLLANATSTEDTTNDGRFSQDFLSNGFKIRASHATTNQSGATYIYMAFAEAPFKSGTGATTIEGTAR